MAGEAFAGVTFKPAGEDIDASDNVGNMSKCLKLALRPFGLGC